MFMAMVNLKFSRNSRGWDFFDIDFDFDFDMEAIIVSIQESVVNVADKIMIDVFNLDETLYKENRRDIIRGINDAIKEDITGGVNIIFEFFGLYEPPQDESYPYYVGKAHADILLIAIVHFEQQVGIEIMNLISNFFAGKAILDAKESAEFLNGELRYLSAVIPRNGGAVMTAGGVVAGVEAAGVTAVIEGAVVTAGTVVAGIVIVTQIAGYGATMNFVDHMELLKKTKKDFKGTGNLKFTLNSIKDLARKTGDEIREILKNNSSLSFKNGDEILTSEVNDILNKINPSDKSGVSRNYTALEAVNQARINKLYNNNSSFKNLISSRSKVFRDKIDRMINALKDSIERFEERNKVCFEMKEDCLYNVSKKEYVDKDEVPGIYRLRKVEVEKNTF